MVPAASTWWGSLPSCEEAGGATVHAAFSARVGWQPLLESIPVKVITNDKIALFGAAALQPGWACG